MIITEDYVSFETAKLLKEKGFDWECEKAYISSEAWSEANYEPPYTNKSFNEYFEKDCCTKPTLQMAMKWLREVHKLCIEPFRSNHGYLCIISEIPTGSEITEIPMGLEPYSRYDGIDKDSGQFPLYEKATEAAIKYCLENLI